MKRRVNVIGVGMTKFCKPGQSPEYYEMAAAAGRAALADAGISYEDIEQVFAGYVFGESTCGQRSAYELGMTGIPVINVNNNCATGSTALFLARQAIEGGLSNCVLALGFEKMQRGAIPVGQVVDRDPPLGRHTKAMVEMQGSSDAPWAAQIFGGAGREYIERFGCKPETFARITVKARQHAAQNPYAIFNQKLTVEEVLASDNVYGPLTRFQCCPPTCGAAAAVLCSEEFARKHIVGDPVYIAAQAMTTDCSSTFRSNSLMNLVGCDMAQRAGQQAFEQSGIGPEDVDVVELHDCFTTNELFTYEALGLCPKGGGEKFICDGDNTYGGKVVTNPSGGLLSKGHPLGATGLAQCAELVWQLRGQAQNRQVKDARVALQHNIGLGGACVVTMYRRD